MFHKPTDAKYAPEFLAPKTRQLKTTCERYKDSYLRCSVT